jgi:hypothetical protein
MATSHPTTNGRPGDPRDLTDPDASTDTDHALMRARLAAMAKPRDDDSPKAAALRAILRDQRLMARVTANVESWPPLTDDQRETLAALLHPRHTKG